VAVVSAAPYANHLNLAPDREPCRYSTRTAKINQSI